MSLIEFRNIGKTFFDDGPTTVALSGANFSIDRGEFISIVGPSGSGKSTMLHILGLLDRPSEGVYLLDSKSVDELKAEMLALLKEHFNLRIQRGIGQPPKVHLFKKVKLTIARIKTILKEKGLNV